MFLQEEESSDEEESEVSNATASMILYLSAFAQSTSVSNQHCGVLQEEDKSTGAKRKAAEPAKAIAAKKVTIFHRLTTEGLKSCVCED